MRGVGRAEILLFVFLFCLSVCLGSVVVKCLLNAFAMSLFVKRVLLNCMAALSCLGACLSESVLIVRQSMFVFLVWLQSPEIFSCHSCFLCVAMLLFISWLRVWSCGSLWLFVLTVFLCWMSCRMCMGRMLVFVC